MNFYFHTFLWCVKKVLLRPSGLYKTFLGHHKVMWKQKFKLIFISIQYLGMFGMERVKKDVIWRIPLTPSPINGHAYFVDNYMVTFYPSTGASSVMGLPKFV